MILTEAQAMLRDMVGRYVTDNVADLATSSQTRANGAWNDFARSLGILGLTLTEEHGGLACGAVETMLVVEQLGAALAAEPFVSNAVTTATLLNGIGEPGLDLAVRLAAGEALVAPAIGSDCEVMAAQYDGRWHLSGRSGIVVSGAIADFVVVPAHNFATQDLLLFVIPEDAVGMERRTLNLLDRNPAAEFTFDAHAVVPGPLPCRNVADLLAQARDAAHAAYCAELVGIMDRMLRDTVAYTTLRTQFGQPLARFQVLQHRMAAMHVEVEMARSMALMAAITIDGGQPGRSKAISAALARTLKAAREVAHGTVQLHGGIGTTDELMLGRHFKRIRTLASLLGPADSHVANFAASHKV